MTNREQGDHRTPAALEETAGPEPTLRALVRAGASAEMCRELLDVSYRAWRRARADVDGDARRIEARHGELGEAVRLRVDPAKARRWQPREWMAFHASTGLPLSVLWAEYRKTRFNCE